MELNCIRSAAIAALMLFGISTAGAQEISNLGELLDKGAKRLDAAELKALLTGATASGKPLRADTRTEFEITFEADGQIKGRLYGLHPTTPMFLVGTWRINDQGEICTETHWSGGSGKGCNYYYSLNNAYYGAASVDDRSAIARMRKIKR